MTAASKLQLFAISAFAIVLVSCAKSGGDDSSSTPTCPAGQLYTAGAGCLPQCGVNMVYYNNQCVSTTSIAAGLNYGASCGSGRLQSQYGCLPQCGVSAVLYNNQCVQITQNYNGVYNGGTNGIVGGGTSVTEICGAGCPQGYTRMSNGTCLPQATCTPCYGLSGKWCYKGVNADYWARISGGTYY